MFVLGRNAGYLHSLSSLINFHVLNCLCSFGHLRLLVIDGIPISLKSIYHLKTTYPPLLNFLYLLL